MKQYEATVGGVLLWRASTKSIGRITGRRVGLSKRLMALLSVLILVIGVGLAASASPKAADQISRGSSAFTTCVYWGPDDEGG